jgi:hypothetical protein
MQRIEVGCIRELPSDGLKLCLNLFKELFGNASLMVVAFSALEFTERGPE